MRQLWVLVCAFLMGTSAFAQSDRGTITGTVVDQTSAVIPGARVVATNTETSARFETLSTETGNYTLAQLPAGVYQLAAELPGFKRYVRQGITVLVAQTLRIDLVLEVGVALSTGDHRPDEVFALPDGVDEACDNMERDDDQENVEEPDVPTRGERDSCFTDLTCERTAVEILLAQLHRIDPGLDRRAQHVPLAHSEHLTWRRLRKAPPVGDQVDRGCAQDRGRSRIARGRLQSSMPSIGLEAVA